MSRNAPHLIIPSRDARLRVSAIYADAAIMLMPDDSMLFGGGPASAAAAAVTRAVRH
jgi:hypothetical protein